MGQASVIRGTPSTISVTYYLSTTVHTTDIILPFLSFPVFSTVAYHFIFNRLLGHTNLIRSSFSVKLARACNASSPVEAAPFRLHYTSFDRIDDRLCILVTFFQAAIKFSDSFTYTK